MNEAASELQGTFNDYITINIFFCPNYGKYLGQNSIQY